VPRPAIPGRLQPYTMIVRYSRTFGPRISEPSRTWDSGTPHAPEHQVTSANGKGVKAATAVANTVKVPAKIEKSKWSWMRVEQIEEKIAFFEEKLAELDQELADPDVWTDHEKANTLTEKRDGIKGELDDLEAEWLRKAE